MRAGIVCLGLAYVLSQFYRAFLAVLAPALQAPAAQNGIGLSAQDLADASGLWFLAFALMQLPIGAALDRFGPRRTVAVLLSVGALGTALFASAQGAFHIKAAMALIGVGCAPVLMASYFIFARIYPPRVFGLLAGLLIAVGSLGNIAASLPLAAAADALGWRGAVWGLAAVTALAAALAAATVRDPGRLAEAATGSVLDLLAMRALWPVLAMMAVNYLPSAGLRGLWVGPYFADVFGADAAGIGRATLAMGAAMVAGNVVYALADRPFGTRKGVILAGTAASLACLLGLVLWPAATPALSTALLAGVGLFGASFGMVVAHGRAFFPPHLMGRGVTLLNLFGIAPIGLAQLITGRLHAAVAPAPVAAPYAAVFLFFAVVLLAGTLIYAFAADRTD